MVILVKLKKFKKLEITYGQMEEKDKKEINFDFLKNQCLYKKGCYKFKANKTDHLSNILLQMVNFKNKK